MSNFKKFFDDAFFARFDFFLVFINLSMIFALSDCLFKIPANSIDLGTCFETFFFKPKTVCDETINLRINKK